MERQRVSLVLAVLIALVLGGWSAPVQGAEETVDHPVPSRAAIAAPASVLDPGKDEAHQNEDKDKDKGEDKEGKEDKDTGKAREQGDGEAAEPVMPTVGYQVEVSCLYDGAADQTTCIFQGRSPEGAQDISHLDIPDAAVCADVVGGDYEAIDPDPNTGVTGYKSHGSTGRLSLVLSDEVTVDGTAEYWIKAADKVFPVTGPAVQCGGAAASATAPAKEATDAAGSLVLTVAQCPEKPVDDDAYDWYGLCPSGPGDQQFQVVDRASGLEVPLTPTTSGTGMVVFAPLAPGAYELRSLTGAWCHAESDNVTAEGDVVVEDQQVTNVWFFFCPDAEPTS